MATDRLLSFFPRLAYALRTRPRMRAHAGGLGPWAQTAPSIDAMVRDVPAGVFLGWKEAMQKAHPAVRFDDSDWAVACTGLVVHFRMLALDAGRARGGVALASVAAARVWRIWETWDAQQLRSFLDAHLGHGAQYVGPSPLDARTWSPRALANAWVLAESMQGIDVGRYPGAQVAAIFAVDRQIKMPGGFAFYRDGANPTQGYYRLIDARGVVGDVRHGADVLSANFLYVRTHLDAPEPASHKDPSLLAQAFGMLGEVLSRHRREGSKRASAPPRGTRINPTRARRNHSSGDAFSSEDSGSFVPAVMAAVVVLPSSSSSTDCSGASCGSSGAGGD